MACTMELPPASLLPQALDKRLEPTVTDEEQDADLTVVVRGAISGEVMAEVRCQPGSTMAEVCHLVMRETGESGVTMTVIFKSEVMDSHAGIGESGIGHGDTIFVVQTPLRCLTASSGGVVRLESLSQQKAPQEALVVDIGDKVLSASVSPDGSRLLTVSAEGEACIWDAQSGVPLHQLQGEVAFCAFSPDGTLLGGTDADGVGRLWCAATGESLHKLDANVENADDETTMAVFSSSGNLLLTCQGSEAHLWDVSTGAHLGALAGHGDTVRSAGFSPDGTEVVTASADGTARTWSTSSRQCLNVNEGHEKGLTSATFSPNGRIVATTAVDGTARLWEGGRCIAVFLAEGGVANAAAFSPDSSQVLLVEGSEDLRVFNVASGECQMTLSGHQDWVRAAAWSPDGAAIATASYDGTARIFSALDGRLVGALEGDVGALLSAELVPR